MSKKGNQVQSKNNSITLHRQEIRYSGILPPAEQFKKYDEACPGAAKQILEHATNQINHRIEKEKKITEANIKNQRLGIIFAFIVVISFLIVGFILILKDKGLFGFSAFVAAFVPILGYFFSRKRQEKNEKSH